MGIRDILEQAKIGALDACQSCPWSPRRASVGFGVSCHEHGIDWRTAREAHSMLVVQDPGDTTPQLTGRLCTVHNSHNPTDRTAQQNLSLWKAAVALDDDDPDAGGHLRRHYWANAIMHGASRHSGSRTPKAMEEARICCSAVLAAQIKALSPRVIIASGAEAVKTLNALGLVSRPWSGLRDVLPGGANREINAQWLSARPVWIYCTYHTSAGVVDMTRSRPRHTLPARPPCWASRRQ